MECYICFKYHDGFVAPRYFLFFLKSVQVAFYVLKIADPYPSQYLPKSLKWILKD